MKIGDEVYVHGYVDEIRNDVVIIRNDGGYFGTVEDEVICFKAEFHKDYIEPKVKIEPSNSEKLNNCTDCECTDDCTECKEAEHGCKTEPQTEREGE